MTLSRTGTAVSAAALALGAVVLAAPAHAASWSHQDPKMDMVYYAGGTGSYGPNGDVRTIKATYGATRLAVTSTFTQLRPAPGVSVGAHLRVHTSTGHDYRFFMDTGSSGSPHWLVQRDGKGFTCSGFKRSADFTHATVSWSVPRTCLGKPGSVRISVEGHNDNGSEAYYDDGLRSHAYTPGKLAYSTRISHG